MIFLSVDFKIRLHFAALSLAVFVAVPTASHAATTAEGTTECYQIENSRVVIDTRAVKGKLGAANRGHQIGGGKHTVISIRRYLDPVGAPDSGTFFKTTIELRKIPTGIGAKEFSEVPVIYSFHSEGSTGFVYKGAYAWSNRPLRKISIKREAGGLRVSYAQNVLGKDAASGKVRPMSLTANCHLRKLMVSDLSLWQGYAGTGDQSFYPPPQ